LLDKILTHSLNDLRLLRNQIGEQAFFTAGVPWYVALFGRDSLIAALQTLALDPSVAAQTLRLLAEYQGREADEWRAEEPGKILHELRVGELARLGEIPHTPYYGSVDSTPLFLITLAEYVAWSGDLDLFEELRSNVDRALAWMDEYGDLDGDGYLEYESKSRLGLINQGWKDSWEAIVNADGSLARHPIALVEAQGYAYHAKIALAGLFERVGEEERAADLRKTAGRLQQRFNRDFWLEDLGFYALALQAEKEPAAVISSNPGHALWSGIVPQDRAQKVVERLLAADMFSGWGIRTLSEESRAYNPTGYHLGTVWPHDNSLILAGFRRYGFDREAQKVFRGMAEAAMHFKNYRLPELFAGFPQSGYNVPVRYPVACHPQAWSAGTIPFMVQALLGLAPEALDQRLRIVRPVLPDFVRQIKVHRMRVGNAFVDLCFEKTSDDRCGVNVLKVEGDLDVVVGA
jgi:glycogen debranching enzyme